MKILITGCNGFLGYNLIKILGSSDYKLIGTSLTNNKTNAGFNFVQCDLLNLKASSLLVKSCDPDIIINTIALTDVDFCEKHQEEAYKINVITTANLVKSISREKTKLIHISTDQLFDGLRSFYSEEDTTRPPNIYGKTKLMAEEVCFRSHHNTVVIRTNFFGFSPRNHKPTFAEWILNSLKKRTEINMFNDLFFTPLEVSILVKAIEQVFLSEYQGVLNIAGNARISKYDFGIKLAEKCHLDPSLINSISMNEFSFNAPRQPDMSLSIKKYNKLFSHKLPNLNESLDAFVNQ